MLVALFTLTACTKSQAEQGAALNQVSKIILPLVVVPVLIGLLRKARKRKDDNLYSLIKMLLWLLALAYPIVLLAPSHI